VFGGVISSVCVCVCVCGVMCDLETKNEAVSVGI
jgi:hypothetical protein